MKKRIYILIIILSVIFILTFFWWKQAIKPVNPQSKSYVSISIKANEPVRDIAERLQKAGLIRSAVAFFLQARFGGLGQNIQAGDFRLAPNMDLMTIGNMLTHGTKDVWITVVEGLRIEEIAMILSHELEIPEKEFIAKAKEGYMFPDTYLVPKHASASSTINLFLANFNNKVSQEIRDRGKKKGLSLNDIIIIASLVEREAKYDKDRPIIASVILNRLKIGMKLDIDATVQYALGYQTEGKTWWKKDLTIEDLQTESVYNTYINPGLPPTPICNPGLAVIQSVVDAPDTNYLYYLADEKGESYFSESYEEHGKNIQKYLN